jgi:hypothetical protein
MSVILIGYDILTPQRGEHDIENQMIFEGNPGFVFHDSFSECGTGLGRFRVINMLL